MGNPSKTIAENSMRLYMDYQNNPLNIKKGGVDETLKELDKFRQVGPGKTALIMKNFVRFGFWDFNVYELPMKIDRHVVRISLGTGVVKTDEEVIRADKLVYPLMGLYREITREEKISGVDLDDAMWVIGSYICLKNNKSYCDMNCPFGCEKRPPSDNNAVFFQSQIDKRKGKGQGSLFGF